MSKFLKYLDTLMCFKNNDGLFFLYGLWATDKQPTKKMGIDPNRSVSYRNEKSLGIVVIPRLSLVAGMGFEPHDLRVMSPTSYQAALPRDIKLRD